MMFASTTPRHFKLQHGLALSYNPQQQIFRIGRIDVPPSPGEITTVRRDALSIGVLLTAAPEIHQVTDKGHTWHYAEWKLETVKL